MTQEKGRDFSTAVEMTRKRGRNEEIDKKCKMTEQKTNSTKRKKNGRKIGEFNKKVIKNVKK